MTSAPVLDLGIERLVRIDERIDAREGDALRDRWEFGRAMLDARDGKGRLPNGYLAALVERTNKSRSELSYRAQFAERFPTEAERSNVLDSYRSWFEVTQRGLKVVRDDAPVEPPVVPAGQFSTIVADPPWRYGNTSTRGAAQDHYDTLSIEQLRGDEPLPDGTNLAETVREKSAEQSHLYLWATAGHLPHAFDVMAAWGFEYKTYLVWVKPQMGMGNYFRVSTELVLFGIKGGIRTNAMDQMNYFNAKRGKHSAKPSVFYDIVAKCSPGPYLEMFQRCTKAGGSACCTSCRLPGWSGWGNEAAGSR